MAKRLIQSGRASFAGLIVFALLASVGLPLAFLYAADITPGYTFTPGERNVSHTKLNSLGAGTINTSWHTTKGSAGADPNTAFEFMIYDTTLGVFKRISMAAGIFDHSALLSSRTAKTAPVLDDAVLLMDSAAANAYKKMTWTNLFFGGAASGAATNESRFPALLGGAAGSISLSNLLGGLTAHALATNGDLVVVLTENGRAVKTMTLQSLFTTSAAGTNFSGDHLMVSWDGTRLRANRATNLIDGLSVTNSTPTTNDAFVSLQAGQIKKLFLNELRGLMRVQNVVQSKYTTTTNIAGSSGNWSNIVDIGTSSLSNTISLASTSSKVLVRLVMHAAVQGAGQPGHIRVLRGGSAIGVGDDDGASRTEAGAPVETGGQLENVVWEWLDSPGATSASYTVQAKVLTTGTFYLNRTQGDGNSEQNGRLASTLTLEEVFQ